MGRHRIFAVIDMYRKQSFKSDHIIKTFKDAVKIICQIIASVPYVTCVKADSDFRRVAEQIHDLCQFFESLTDFAALPCHRLEKNRCRYPGFNNIA